MDTIVSQAIKEIKILSENTPDGRHIITGDIRRLAARLYKNIDDKSIENVLCLCEELLEEHSFFFQKVTEWTKDEDFWVRRASAVILIPAILHNDYEGISPLRISDSLMKDEHDLVQKGYGWMLKCLSQVDMETVKDYLILNHAQMPRTAYRYALEKFDKETRKNLMNL